MRRPSTSEYRDDTQWPRWNCSPSLKRQIGSSTDELNELLNLRIQFRLLCYDSFLDAACTVLLSLVELNDVVWHLKEFLPSCHQ